MPALTGFVLAGGKSRRMGTDKALLPWNGNTLLDHMTRTIGTVADSVRIVGRDGLLDRNPGRGPVEGIATALAATTTRDNLIVAVDLPYIESAFLRYLADRLGESPTGFVACSIGGPPPLCLGLRRNLLTAIDAYLDSGERSLRGLLQSVTHDGITEGQFLESGFSAGMFRNLNTPEDLPARSTP